MTHTSYSTNSTTVESIPNISLPRPAWWKRVVRRVYKANSNDFNRAFLAMYREQYVKASVNMQELQHCIRRQAAMIAMLQAMERGDIVDESVVANIFQSIRVPPGFKTPSEESFGIHVQLYKTLRPHQWTVHMSKTDITECIAYHGITPIGQGTSPVFLGLTISAAVRAVKRVSLNDGDREPCLAKATDGSFICHRWFDWKEDGHYFYVFTLLNITVEQKINQLKASSSYLSIDEAQSFVHHVLSGVAELHSQGRSICHRDLKPQNLMFDMKGIVKIIDFSHARQPATNGMLIGATANVGTVGWRAPEQTTLEQTRNMDIFCAGLVIYYFISGGQHPFGEIRRNHAGVRGNVTSAVKY